MGMIVFTLHSSLFVMVNDQDQEWLWAADFLPCTEFSDPRIFGPSKVARWMGEIGMAHLRLGRLLPAHNHMQVRSTTPLCRVENVQSCYEE